MTTERLMFIYFVFLSFLFVIIVGRLSRGFFKRNYGLSRIFVQKLFKAYIKQGQRQKIFFIDFLKHPLFLSASFITLQLQLIGLVSSQEEDIFIFIPSSMLFYVVLKVLYIGNVGNRDKTYFNFISALDSFFFDLLLIMMIFAFGESPYREMQWAALVFFVGSIFLKVSNANLIKYGETGCYEKEEIILDQIVFEFGEYIYIISLLFFAISKFVMGSFAFGEGQTFYLLSYHFEIFICIIFITIIVNGMEWVLQWLIKKNVLERQVIRVKYVLTPVILLILVVQAWVINGA